LGRNPKFERIEERKVPTNHMLLQAREIAREKKLERHKHLRPSAAGAATSEGQKQGKTSRGGKSFHPIAEKLEAVKGTRGKKGGISGPSDVFLEIVVKRGVLPKKEEKREFFSFRLCFHGPKKEGRKIVRERIKHFDGKRSIICIRDMLQSRQRRQDQSGLWRKKEAQGSRGLSSRFNEKRLSNFSLKGQNSGRIKGTRDFRRSTHHQADQKPYSPLRRQR